MPVTPTYPGVYIEEIPSGVRTIIGVATSITAFIGRALRGPINEPTTINNFGDFERQFGGLHVDYPMSYAVRDFYLNGGNQAIILRLFKSQEEGKDGRAKYNTGNLYLEAANPGTWGNNLSIKIDYDDIDEDFAARYGLQTTDLFNLTIVENPPRGTIERINNVSLKESAGSLRVDRVLKQQSQRVRIQMSSNAPRGIDADGNRPPETPEAQDPTNPDTEPSNINKFADGADSINLTPEDYRGQKDEAGLPIPKTGLKALDKADLFNLLCIPPEIRTEDTDLEIYKLALPYCVERRAILIVDSPYTWSANKETAAQKAKKEFSKFVSDIGANTRNGRNAVLYFPRVLQADPLRDGQLDTFVPCGILAGVMARTDVNRGVWKAPAGIDAGLIGIRGLEVNLSNSENGLLNPLGINCLRNFPVYGRIVWGARTLRGADQLADEYKYLPIRRLVLFLEESLYRGTQWVVFEPNDEPLWAQIRLNIGAFMNNLFRQGAFQGKTPSEAYFVKCDKETNPQNDIDRGIVNIIVGFAPLKPAEFVIIKFQQIAGDIAT
ncbi:MAG: phage tail sheath subtilisin-like domain-containing protein [Prochloraceae cyanobacterium]|nr:phage tail sheath subtilisin-like domain-containing protein [Prochloraceae cyanobacterium]